MLQINMTNRTSDQRVTIRSSDHMRPKTWATRGRRTKRKAQPFGDKRYRKPHSARLLLTAKIQRWINLWGSHLTRRWVDSTPQTRKPKENQNTTLSRRGDLGGQHTFRHWHRTHDLYLPLHLSPARIFLFIPRKFMYSLNRIELTPCWPPELEMAKTEPSLVSRCFALLGFAWVSCLA